MAACSKRAKAPSESIFLTYGELKYVRESDKDQYFELGALGVDVPFRFYKTSAQMFLGALSNKTLPAAQAMLAAFETRQLEDGVFSETVLSEGTDTDTGVRFRVNLVGQVYNGRPNIALISEVYLTNEQRFHPTHRQVRLAISQDEFDTMKEFISEKLMRRLPNKSWTVAKNGAAAPVNEVKDPDDAPDSPEGGAAPKDDDNL